jgi:hypothetical protein
MDTSLDKFMHQAAKDKENSSKIWLKEASNKS